MQNKTMKIFAIIAAIVKPKIAGKHPRAPPELGTTELGTTELGTTDSEDKRTNNKTKMRRAIFTSSLIVIFKVAFLIIQNRLLPNYFWLLF